MVGSRILTFKHVAAWAALLFALLLPFSVLAQDMTRPPVRDFVKPGLDVLKQLAGHVPVVVMGGGTGLIGDPSGKEAERTLRTADEIAGNVAAQRPIFERILDFSGPAAARIVNNADWLTRLSFVEALRDMDIVREVSSVMRVEGE